jgi:hypothetical protein
MRKQPLVLLPCVAWTLLAAGAAMADTNQGMKPGGKGQVTFSSEVRIGDLFLKPGEYTVQCVPAGEERVVRFTRTSGRSDRGSAATDRGDMVCRKEALSSKASRTTMVLQKDGEIPRVVRIELNGESAAHLF